MRTKERTKTLLTPGPLTTALKTKQAMLVDIGSREPEFTELMQSVIDKLQNVANMPSTMSCVPMQGPSTFSIEATLGSLIGPKDRLLVLSNGQYGERIGKIAIRLGIDVHVLSSSSVHPINIDIVSTHLDEHSEYSHIAAVYCETTTGIVNPLEELSILSRKKSIELIVDAVSAFGALELDLAKMEMAAVVVSANKCLESVPGISFVFINNRKMENKNGNRSSYCLDLYDQWQFLSESGQFRFTPPTQVILALHAALISLEEEGGATKRIERYKENSDLLLREMEKMGFRLAIKKEYASPIILPYLNDANIMEYEELSRRLSDSGFIIYPGKLPNADTFRIGCIGAIDSNDIKEFLRATKRIINHDD